MARTAVFVDLGFFLVRFKKLKLRPGEQLNPVEVAASVWNTARAHIGKDDELYRILVYDCPPLSRRACNPVTKRGIDFSRTPIFQFRSHLHKELLRKRKVALRLGELSSEGQWIIQQGATKALLSGSVTIEQLKESDVKYDIRQKGVDLRMGLDIAAITFKGLANRVVLITGDSDFVPATKMARREGIDVVLDPLWAPITPSLNEHIDGLKTTWERPFGLKSAAAA